MTYNPPNAIDNWLAGAGWAEHAKVLTMRGIVEKQAEECPTAPLPD